MAASLLLTLKRGETEGVPVFGDASTFIKKATNQPVSSSIVVERICANVKTIGSIVLIEKTQ